MEQAACLKLTRQKLQIQTHMHKTEYLTSTPPPPQNLGTMDQQEGNQLTPPLFVQNKESTATVTKRTIQIIQSGFFFVQ